MSLTVPLAPSPRRLRPAGTGRGGSWRLDPLLPLVAVTLVALVARLHGIDGKPYWMDEITTLRRSSLGFGALLRDSLSFHHLPLYFLVTSWLTPFGLDERVMRLPAAMFGAVCTGILFLLGRSLAGWRAGLAASLLLAFSPFQVQYGQEARSYTMVTGFILLALWGLTLLARDPRAAGGSWRGSGMASMRLGWLLYGIGTTLALDTLSVALLWLLAANLSAVVIGWRAGPGRGGFARRWSLVQLAVLACYLPFVIAMMVLTRGDVGSGLNWVPPLTWSRFWIALDSVYLQRTTSLISFRVFSGPLDPGGIGWTGLCVAALAALGLAGVWRRGTIGHVLSIALLTLPVGVAAVSIVSSVWMPRYLLWSGPVFLLLAGLGLARLPSRWQNPALGLLCVVSLLNLLPYYRTETKPLWNQAAAILLQKRHPGDLVITDDPGTVNMMNVYLNRTGQWLRPYEWTTHVGQAVASQHAGHRVFAVHGHVGQNDPYRLLEFEGLLSPLGTPSATRAVGLDIVILDFPAAPG